MMIRRRNKHKQLPTYDELIAQEKKDSWAKQSAMYFINTSQYIGEANIKIVTAPTSTGHTGFISAVNPYQDGNIQLKDKELYTPGKNKDTIDIYMGAGMFKQWEDALAEVIKYHTPVEDGKQND